MLGLHCCAGFSLVVASGGYSLISVCGLLIAVASLVAEDGLQGMWASVVDTLGLSCSAALPGAGILHIEFILHIECSTFHSIIFQDLE